MTEIGAALTEIERGLERLGRKIALRRLLPGLEPTQIRAQLADVGLPCDSDLVELYQWRNGIDSSDTSNLIKDLCLFPISYMTSLDHMLADYRAFIVSDRWDASWLPLFPDGGGDFYALETRGQNVGAVRQFWIDEDEAPIMYESLGAMLASIGEAYRMSLYTVKENGWLTIRDEDFTPIAQRHNPTIEWWTGARA